MTDLRARLQATRCVPVNAFYVVTCGGLGLVAAALGVRWWVVAAAFVVAALHGLTLVVTRKP